MTGEFLIDGVDFKEMMDESDRAKAALAAEQREHDITRRQRDTLQTQCEDMQSEMETEMKLNNASLKPSAKVLQQEQDDEMACMAEEVQALKAKLSETLGHCVVLADANGELNIHNKNHLTTIRHLRCKIEELNDSAETHALHMQQVEAACKAAEAKVIEQRKEIEALKSGVDLWICPSADTCIATPSECKHTKPHSHYGDGCDIICVAAKNKCVKVTPCKECAKMREEIINRDAVILEQERKADRTDEIMRTAFDQLNKLRGCVEKRNAATEKHNSYTVMLSCKSGDMHTPEIYICPDGLCCDTAREVGCLHSGFHASDTGGCDGCSQVPGGGCVKASEHTMPDEIAAFESLVNEYLVSDAELSPSGKMLRDEIINSIECMSHKVHKYDWEKNNKFSGWARG